MKNETGQRVVEIPTSGDQQSSQYWTTPGNTTANDVHVRPGAGIRQN
jgi:hypothetical protein